MNKITILLILLTLSFQSISQTFTQITSGDIVIDSHRTKGPSWGDYDNDGYLDLFVASYGDCLLYHNNGDGTFSKITTGAIVSDEGASTGAVWGDYDNDGYLDLFVANRFSQNNFLYNNNGDGTFTKITVGNIVNDGEQSQGGNWIDYDNDGYLDLFVANEAGAANFLYNNNGDGTFTQILTGTIVTDNFDSKSSAWADYDNDDDIDLFVPCNGCNNYVYSNNGDGTFTRDTSSVLDNGGGLESISASWADYDKDGFQDLFVGNGGTSNQVNFLYNNDGNSNNWINIKLTGITSNKTAIGAQVRLKATINSNPVWQMREISGQSGRTNQNSLNASVGLGDATNIDSLIIEWPSGLVCTFTNMSTNQFIEIDENCIIIGIDELSTNNSINIYPNPMVTEAIIELPLGQQEVALTLYDVMGRKQGVSYTVNNNRLTIQRGNLPGGIYFFAVTNGKQIYTGKLAVK